MHQKILAVLIVLTFKNCSINIFRIDLLSRKYVEKNSYSDFWNFYSLLLKKKNINFFSSPDLFPNVFSVVHLLLQIPNFFTFMIYHHDSIPTYKTNYDSTQHWHCIFHPCNNPQMRKVRIICPVSLMNKNWNKKGIGAWIFTLDFLILVLCW